MKKTLLILLAFTSLISKGQIVPPSGYTGLNARYDWLAGKFRTIHLPSGTSPALGAGAYSGPGALYYKTSDSSVYAYTGTQWRKVSSGADLPALSNSFKMIRVNRGGSALEYFIPSTFGWKDTTSMALTGCTGIFTYGDSWATNSFVSATTYWPARLRDSLGLTLTNGGANSAGWFYVANHIMSGNFLSGSRDFAAAILVGNADVLSNEATQSNRNKVSSLTQVALANLFLKSIYRCDTVTRSGFSNSSLPYTSKSATIGGNVQVASSTGSTMTIKWTGDNIVIMTPSSVRGTAIGSFKIVIDGLNGFGGTQWVLFNGSEKYASYGSFVPASESGLTKYPDVVIIRGLANTYHEAVITTLSNTATYIDAYGILEAPGNCKPVVVGSIPHVNEKQDLNFTISPLQRPRHNDYADVISTSIRDGVDMFSDFPVSYVDVNKYWNPYVQTSLPDNLHPTASGEDAVGAAMYHAFLYKRIDKMDFRNSKTTYSDFFSLDTQKDSVYVPLAGNFTDTTNYKPLTQKSDGTIKRATYWPGSGGSGWGLAGNSITAGVDFLGTTNNTSLRFYTNNTFRGLIDSISGNLLIGVAVDPDLDAFFQGRAYFKGTNASRVVSTIVENTNTGGGEAFVLVRNGSRVGELMEYSDVLYNGSVTNLPVYFISNNAAIMKMYYGSGVGFGSSGANAPTSTVDVQGSFGTNYVAKTANYTATASDHTIDCTSGTFTITLPAAAGITGREYVIKNTGAGTITIDGNASETIDGATTKGVSPAESYCIQSTGANWIIVYSHIPPP